MAPVTAEATTFDVTDEFDLDLDVEISELMSSPAITSVSLCTPGCTSAGGGSNCSFCC